MVDSITVYAKRMMDISNPEESSKLVNDYYNACKKICDHDEYIDIGYCKVHNGEYQIVDKENADVRILKCAECPRCIMLLKTKNENWDILYGNKEIKIITNKKIGYCKKKVLK